MTRCLKQFFAACKARGLDGFSMKAVQTTKNKANFGRPEQRFDVYHQEIMAAIEAA